MRPWIAQPGDRTGGRSEWGTGSSPVRATRNASWEGTTLAARMYLFWARRIPDHPMKLRLVRKCGAWLFRGGIAVRGPTRGIMFLDLTRPDFIVEQIVRFGSWEPKTLRLATDLMGEGGTFLDVGSHCGVYPCVVGLLPGVECIAVEASPRNFLYLQKNVISNASNAKLVHAAVSSAEGIVQFDTPFEPNPGGARVLFDTDERKASTFYVPAIPIKQILETLKPKLPIRLMKVDVEGHEMNVLNGMDWSGPYRPQHVIAEFDHGMLKQAGITPDSFLQAFAKRGYEALALDGTRFQPSGVPEEWNVWFKGKAPEE